jgi:hypothetical protein
MFCFGTFVGVLLKRVGFVEEGQGFPKKLFNNSKSTVVAAAADLVKRGFDFELKRRALWTCRKDTAKTALIYY